MFSVMKPVSTSSILTPASHSSTRATIRELGTGFVAPYHSKENEPASLHPRPVCGPFRATMNAGDTLGRQFLQCDCPNPLGSKAAKLTAGDGISSRGCGIVVNGFTTKQVPIANCNPRKVYDSSDYIQFKKIQAQKLGYINRNRLAKSSGGYLLQHIQRVR